MVKNIIFDFDGVLVDSEGLIAKSFSEYLSKRNITFTEKQLNILSRSIQSLFLRNNIFRSSLEEYWVFVRMDMSIFVPPTSICTITA